MNGAVYISFFQGQLESVLEQVVQLAVQEISKTVGSSLNGLLLETAVKEQENRRLQLQIQARESDHHQHGAPGKSKAAEERPEGGQPGRQLGPGGHSSDRGLSGDTRRLEQRGRVVEQLKSVMQRVLEFAVSELTKIVEASFDDLLLEITKMDKEHQSLEERLGLSRSMERPAARDRSSSNRGRRNSENDSMSPSGSEDNREDMGDKEPNHRGPRPADLSSAQDWVPILDKVFGQKWCGDVWSAEQLEGGVSTETGGSGRGSAVAPPLSLEPRPSSPQQDPRWTPLEDMEVFSPDDDEEAPVTTATASATVTTATASALVTTTTTASGSSPGNKARRSSASMLHRLLTLPSQLLEEEDADDSELESIAVSMATEAAAGATETARSLASPAATRDEEDEEEEEEEEEGRRKRKRRRVWSECEDCGRRFSRVSLLKAHRQTHLSESPPPPTESPAPSLSCDQCGKRFSSNTRLHSHVQTNHVDKQA